jgi:hypothetical protein
MLFGFSWCLPLGKIIQCRDNYPAIQTRNCSKMKNSKPSGRNKKAKVKQLDVCIGPLSSSEQAVCQVEFDVL